MATITVKQYVMLLTAEHIVTAASRMTPDDVDCERPFSLYASTFGKDLVMAETDCEELDQYGIDDIEDIEKYVESHGGIDFEATTSHAVETAIKAL